MKLTNSPLIFGLLLLTCGAVSSLSAQEGRPTDPPAQDEQVLPQKPQDVRGNVLRQLGLTREQAQQMRRINQERKPLMEVAQKRLREANRALDEAIYADQVNETDFQARLKEHQVAQAEVARLRFTNELTVRRMLSPEQLVRFRDLRQKFERVRQNMERRTRSDGNQGPVNGNVKPFQPVTRRNVPQNQQRPKF